MGLFLHYASVHTGIRHNAAVHRIERLTCTGGEHGMLLPHVRFGHGNLLQHVGEALRVAHEVTTRQFGVFEHLRQTIPAGPVVDDVHNAENSR